MYNIWEVRIEYKLKKLHRVTVLVEISEHDIRALTSSTCYVAGYDVLLPNESVNDALFQRVAGYGSQLPISKMGKVFPRWRVNHGFTFKK